MDLRETWNELQQQSFDINIIEDGSLESMIHQQSASPMDKLRSQVFKKMMFIVGFVILFLAVMPFINKTIVQILLLVLTLAYVIGGIILWQEYNLLKTDIPMDNNLLESLKSYRDRIKAILKYEELIGLILYPISATLGFMWSFTQDHTVAEVFEKPFVWMTLVITLIVLTPACHWLARWMNKKAFGKYLDQLEENISTLESS
ncbi:MAG: hypothetical protein AAFP02_16300 [Bacteroidota bacterium]